ncbi:MAG: GNAT family N-acetyltransferase [Meiothermus sp.]|nr:GNAT family N-acetyltransferase [Meiothermus sp.]
MNLTRAIEQSYFDHIRSMAIRRHVDAGNLEYIHTGLKLHNRVFNARLEGNFDPQVLELIQRFDLWRVPLIWDVSPSSRPADLGQHLERFGFVRRAELLGMGLELSGLRPAPLPQGVSLEPVTEANFDMWSKVIALANGLPRTRMAMFQKIYEPTLRMPRWRHFLALAEGTPAATCSLLAPAPEASDPALGVYWVATAPKFQRQGLASGVVSRLLEACCSLSWAVLHSTPEGLEIYRRLGFADDLPYTVYMRQLR